MEIKAGGGAKKTTSGEKSTVYNCYDVSDNRNELALQTYCKLLIDKKC